MRRCCRGQRGTEGGTRPRATEGRRRLATTALADGPGDRSRRFPWSWACTSTSTAIRRRRPALHDQRGHPHPDCSRTPTPRSRTPTADVPPVLLQGQTEFALSATHPSRCALTRREARSRPSRTTSPSAPRLNDNADTMTLSVSAPTPEIASTVLDTLRHRVPGRPPAVGAGRSGRAPDAEVETINTLTRKLTDIDGQLARAVVPRRRRQVPAGPRWPPPGTTTETSLTLYQRNTILNQIQSRQVDYGVQCDPRDRSRPTSRTIVQLRNAARIRPEATVAPDDAFSRSSASDCCLPWPSRS